MSLPTSLTGFLPQVINTLETQVALRETEESKGPSLQQKALAILIASVAAAVISVIDAAAHAVLFVVYTPFVAIKEGVEVITGWQNFAPEALNASDWVMHVKKIHSSVVIFLNAIVQGWTDPTSILEIGKRHNLKPIPVQNTQEGVPVIGGV